MDQSDSFGKEYSLGHCSEERSLVARYSYAVERL